MKQHLRRRRGIVYFHSFTSFSPAATPVNDSEERENRFKMEKMNTRTETNGGGRERERGRVPQRQNGPKRTQWEMIGGKEVSDNPIRLIK